MPVKQFCPQCGERLGAHDRFCGSCGSPAVTRCPTCGQAWDGEFVEENLSSSLKKKTAPLPALPNAIPQVHPKPTQQPIVPPPVKQAPIASVAQQQPTPSISSQTTKTSAPKYGPDYVKGKDCSNCGSKDQAKKRCKLCGSDN